MSQGIHLEFPADYQVGHRFNGEVIIKEKAQNTLHKYKLHFPKYIYQEIWSVDFPHGVNTASVTAVYSKKILGRELQYGYKVLLQDKSTSTTLILSSDGTKLLDSWHHEGILLTCFCSGWSEYFVHVVEKTDGEYEIVIIERNIRLNNKDISETRLQPVAAKPTWSHPYLSLCKSNSRIAVTSTDHTLDIYSKFGK